MIRNKKEYYLVQLDVAAGVIQIGYVIAVQVLKAIQTE